ncbi:MAG TPA: RagB/SusD family nutrient uptake outer membrane protein, partial [Leeuwenhoekiella sp.]|nr:RagB/SusD family nutrient uptake outer membrane protein [Leeuwenhoekiella sp.]
MNSKKKKMKLNILKRSSTILLCGALALGSTSCKDDFLDEELTNQYSTEYFETAQGLEDLTVSLYGNIRWHFGYEWAYGLTL